MPRLLMCCKGKTVDLFARDFNLACCIIRGASNQTNCGKTSMIVVCCFAALSTEHESKPQTLLSCQKKINTKRQITGAEVFVLSRFRRGRTRYALAN